MPKCQLPDCDNDVEMTKRGKWKKHCSLKCRGRHNSIVGIEKRKQTCLDRFGTTTNLLSSDTRDKIKDTLMVRYGVTHQMHIPSTKEKIKNTLVERYGVDNPSKSENVKQKKVNTSLVNYGTAHPLQSSEIQNARKLKSLEVYGVDHYSKTPMFKASHPNQSHITPDNYKKLKDPDWLKEHSSIPCSELATILGVTKDTIAKSYRRLGIARSCSYTYGEDGIAAYIRTLYDGAIVRNTRKVVGPRELDIYLPDINLAIEYNGVYWHSELNGKDKNLSKTAECEKLSIRLLQLFDSEWQNKQDIVKSRLSGILMKNQTIHARKCKLVTLAPDVYSKFFDNTHIQGAIGANVAYGLCFEGELVAAMSFGKSRYDKKLDWELLRFSNKLFTNVVGGASKLFQHFIKEKSPNSIVSYSDLRWNTGNLYHKLGFNFVRNSGPNYWYTRDYRSPESRVRYQKHKLQNLLEKYDANLSEWENMQENGYDRIWDCGNSVFHWVAN